MKNIFLHCDYKNKVSLKGNNDNILFGTDYKRIFKPFQKSWLQTIDALKKHEWDSF